MDASKDRPLCMVKIGGSIITDMEDGKPVVRGEAVNRLLREIEFSRFTAGFDVVIGNGAGHFGHVPAKKYKVHMGIDALGDRTTGRVGAIRTQNAVADLNRAIVEQGLEIGIPLKPFAASSFLLNNNSAVSDGFAGGISTAVDWGYVPVVYGDVPADATTGTSIASTEAILMFLAQELSKTKRITKIVIGTDVDGLLTADPNIDKDAKLIPRVIASEQKTTTEFMAQFRAGDSTKTRVTGGMNTKFDFLIRMVRLTGAKAYLVHAGIPGRIEKVLRGEETVCTVVE